MAVNLSFVENDEDFSAKELHNGVACYGNTESVPESSSTPSLNPPSSTHLDGRPTCSNGGKINISDLESRNKIKNSTDSCSQSNLSAPSNRSRRKARVERNFDYKAVLQQKFENSENSFSDSEVTVRNTKTNRIRTNSNQRSGIENRQPCQKPLSNGEVFANGHAFHLQCERSSPQISSGPVQPCAVITNPYSEERNHRHVPANTTETDSFFSIKSRGNYQSLSDSFEDHFSEEVKRIKSTNNSNPGSQPKSPTIVKRKSPYKELVVRRNHSDKERTSSNLSHTNRLSDPVGGSWSDFTKSKKLHSESKSSQLPRRPSSGGTYHHPAMLSNFPYSSHHPESERPKDNKPGKGRDDDDDPSSKRYDEVVFDMLKVQPDDYAKQLTLLDLPVFQAITPDELTGCGWSKKDKWELSPNVCAMTQRFNNTSFWVIREILNASTLKIRAEILTHFIKIAKKLYELNNLHSLMAVIQSLNSSPIIRLSKTWALVSKHHKSSFERLLALLKADDNRSELRTHMEDIKLPCIPFLGIYLSDVMFINSAYPPTSGIESHERSDKINNILRVVAEFQKSEYDLPEKSHILNYLKSLKYIKELEKFVEEDNYKLSLKIEPLVNTEDKSRVKDDPQPGKVTKKGEKQENNSRTPQVPPKHFPGHRKSKSLGKEFIFDPTSSLNLEDDNDQQSKGASLPRSGIPNVTTSLLDDSVLVSTSSLTGHVNQLNGKTGTVESNSGSEHSEDTWMSKQALAKMHHLAKYSKFPLKWLMSTNPPEEFDPDVPTTSVKSSTYPFDKNSPGHSAYKLFMSSDEPASSWRSTRSFSSEMDEFVNTRIRERSDSDDMIDYSAHFDDVLSDDDGIELLSSDKSRRINKSSSKTSFASSSALTRACQSVSNLSTKFSDHSRLCKQYLLSPKIAFRNPLTHQSDSKVGKTVVQSRSACDTSFDTSPIGSMYAHSVEAAKNEKPQCNYEGCIKRKCILKHGRKPTMSTWTKYWLGLYDTNLVYFAAKGSKTTDRHHFKSHPCKVVSVLGWMLLRSKDLNKDNTFQLSNPENGTIYRFQCESFEIAAKWVSALEEALRGNSPPEQDLINLDDS